MDFFDESYENTPPWDIGHPQKEFIGLARNGEIKGSVLDLGCGTGENALFYAEEGHEVYGIDSAPLAIHKAQEKSIQRGVHVHFIVLDALDLKKLNRTFDTATDSGLFHTLTDEDRPIFAENLAAVLHPGGTYFMLCFSELEPGSYGPRRVTKKEIQDSFSEGWIINYIRPAVFESRTWKNGPRAWLSSITKK
ncbi:MAG: methyltransferase domain-containing protein [Methanoregula sp.]|uniref:class I SAM-dependent methyltransferase n=1 Tax=Methanoregula sp. TaxID=2052170 RepID=UPI003BAF2EF3